MTLLAKIVRRRPGDLLLAAEALVLLAVFRVFLAAMPVRRIIRAITQRRPDMQSDAAGSGKASDFARRVQWAVSAIARHSVVEFVCFPQMLAGYMMLRWRKVPSTMVYGVARSPAGELVAHTWLTIGDKILLGGETAGEFTAIERWS